MLRILYIEDNPTDLILVRNMLKGWRSPTFDVMSAISLNEGLEKAGKEVYDALLIDLGLSDSQGLGTIKKTRARFPLIPAIVITGNRDDEVAMHAVQEGADDYLVKGQFGTELLVRAITHAITRKAEKEKLTTTLALLRRKTALLEQSEKEVRRFSQKIISIREDEKRRLSVNLHDELGVMAVGLGINLKIAEEEIRDNKLKAALKRIAITKLELAKAIKALRAIAQDLRPPDLDIIGLHGALRIYFAEMSKKAKIRIDFDIDMKKKQMDDKLAIALYRVSQAAVTNIMRHARATKVKVRLYSNADMIRITIQDNGIGFDVEKVMRIKHTRMGIRGMEERLQSFGGVLLVESQKGRGTKISIVVNTRKGWRS